MQLAALYGTGVSCCVIFFIVYLIFAGCVFDVCFLKRGGGGGSSGYSWFLTWC